jgi:hypothetical protein
MNKFEFTAAVIAAALAFRDSVDEEEQKESLRLIDSGGDSDEAANHDESDLYDSFDTFCRTHGVETLLKKSKRQDELKCIAAVKADEATFTLRGQDITAPTVVRLWADMQNLNPDAGTAEWRKIDNAIETAEKMEKMEDRKWAD